MCRLKKAQRQESLEGGEQTGAGPVGLLAHSGIPSTNI